MKNYTCIMICPETQEQVLLDDVYANTLTEAVESLRSAQSAQVQGWKLVPVEPTPEMLDAAIQDGICVNGKPVWKKDVVFQAKWKYQQMLAAAPSAPKADYVMVPVELAAAAVALFELNEIDGLIPDGLSDILAAAPQPPVQELAVHIKCETTNENVIGTTSLNVVRIEHNDDGSITAVTDHWPASTPAPQPSDDVAKDAARYQWLVKHSTYGIDYRQRPELTLSIYAPDHRDGLSAAIDAAMAGGGV